jgi:hypothetical protein
MHHLDDENIITSKMSNFIANMEINGFKQENYPPLINYIIKLYLSMGSFAFIGKFH